MTAKPPNFTLAGREHIALAADNVRLPTKRVATGPRQADHGPSGPENPGNVGSKAQTSGECRIIILSSVTKFTFTGRAQRYFLFRNPATGGMSVEKSHARPVRLIDVLCCFGIKLECSKHYDLWLGAESLGLIKRQANVPLFKGRVLLPKGDDDPLRAVLLSLGIRVQPARTRQRLDARKFDALASLPPNARFQQFVAPVTLPLNLPRACDAAVGWAR